MFLICMICVSNKGMLTILPKFFHVSNFFPDTELYRQIIYPGYIPYDKVKAKK